MRVLITGALPLEESERRALEALGHEITLHPDERAMVPHPERFEMVVCNGLFLYQPIEAFSALRVIQLTSAGQDRVPLAFIREHGIALHNAAGVYSIPMAEHAVGGLLQLFRQAAFFRDQQRLHRWEKRRDLRELFGRRVCIVGTGSVGGEIAKRLKAFGCRVTGVNRTPREGGPDFDERLPLARLPEAAETCEILILSLALTEETRGLINGALLDRLPAGAVLVNVARGGLVDQSALTAWLQSGRSGGAVLDVFETEPLPEDSPLWDMEHVILTPHNSFVGEGDHARLWRKLCGLLR